MKKKERDVLVCVDDTVEWYTQLTVQVDKAGDEWLTPGQVEFLESAYLWARYEGSNQSKPLGTLVNEWALPMPQTMATIATCSTAQFTKSTRTFNQVLV